MRDFKDIKSLTISEGEIEVPFVLSLEELLNPNKIEFETRTRRPGSKPIIMPRFLAHDKYVIWGLTAVILYHFFKIIELPVKATPTTAGPMRSI